MARAQRSNKRRKTFSRARLRFRTGRVTVSLCRPRSVGRSVGEP